MEATQNSLTSTIPQARALEATAPWKWLDKGWKDYCARPILCAGYGLLFVALGYGIIFGLQAIGLSAAIPVAIGSFALIGPLMAAGLYALSRGIERGERPGWRDMVFVKAGSPMQIAYLGVLLLMSLFIWTLCALALLAIFAGRADIPPGEFVSFTLGTAPGLTLLTLGTLVGGLLAYGIYAVSAFSIPMLIDRNMDFATAMGASVTTVLGQPKPMLLWAWIIAVSIALGAATLLFGFILLFPLIGLATWHGYRDAFSG